MTITGTVTTSTVIGPSPRRPAPRRDRTLTLHEIADLIERVPTIDWSSVIEAAAQDERRRAAAL